MTIGEALKEEQKRLGLTSEAMAAGVITKGTYSKVPVLILPKIDSQ